jgi:hypothetical protein
VERLQQVELLEELVPRCCVALRARKVSGCPKICESARAFPWERSYKRLQLAQLLGRHGVLLTCSRAARAAAAGSGGGVAGALWPASSPRGKLDKLSAACAARAGVSDPADRAVIAAAARTTADTVRLDLSGPLSRKRLALSSQAI